MPRPRVLMVGPTPPPPGGIAAVIHSILASDLTDRFDLTLFATSRSPWKASGRFEHYVNAALCRSFGFAGFVSLETRAWMRAWRAALEPAPDLVHVHVSSGYDFWLGTWMAREARRRGIPSLIHTHGVFDRVVPSWPRAKQAIFHRALRVPDRVIVLSEGWQRWFETRMDASRIVVLRNPVDCRRFAPHEKSDDGIVRLLFVGTNEPERKGGYDILAVVSEVVAEAPCARFVFVGPDVEGIEERLVKGTPIAPSVEFAGSKNTAQIVPYFDAADILLLPSYAEGLPIALLEGMAASLPVVSCPVNAIPEAMRDPDNGIFVAPGDRAALAQAILALVRDPERRRRIGAVNRAAALREFDVSHYARLLGASYDALLAR